MGPYNPVLTPLLFGPVLFFQTYYYLTSKLKLLVFMVRAQKNLQTLTLLVMGGHLTLFQPQPYQSWGHIILFQLLAILTSTFQTQYDRDIKSKVVSLNGQTIDIFSDLNPINHWDHIILSQSPSHPDEYFLGLR